MQLQPFWPDWVRHSAEFAQKEPSVSSVPTKELVHTHRRLPSSPRTVWYSFCCHNLSTPCSRSELADQTPKFPPSRNSVPTIGVSLQFSAPSNKSITILFRATYPKEYCLPSLFPWRRETRSNIISQELSSHTLLRILIS